MSEALFLRQNYIGLKTLKMAQTKHRSNNNGSAILHFLIFAETFGMRRNQLISYPNKVGETLKKL